MISVPMRKAGALAGSAVLASAAMAGALQPAFAADAGTVTPAVDAAASQEASGADLQAAGPQAVRGAFAFSQDVVSGNATISGVFAKAAAALCSGLPQYNLACLCGAPIMVAGPDGSVSQATVENLAADADGKTFSMGCACATNAAGGGAIVNAQVSGVAIADVLASVL